MGWSRVFLAKQDRHRVLQHGRTYIIAGVASVNSPISMVSVNSPVFPELFEELPKVVLS